MRAVLLAKEDKIIRCYENMGVMAKYEGISLATAYQRVKRTTAPMNGIKFWFEDNFLEKYPDSGAAVNKAKENMIMAMDKNNKNIKETKKEDKAIDNELELAAVPATEQKKEKRKMKKVVPTELEMENKEEPSKPEPPKTKPDADKVNHPSHYCIGDIECWDAMVSAFGAEWMRAYATVTAFKYIWRAKHKGHFAEDMKKAAWYEARAAELEERICMK